MRVLSTTVLYLALLSKISAQSAKPTCPFPCTSSNLWEYRVGMRFFFPATQALQERNPVYTEFSKLRSCTNDSIYLVEINYNQLAGKTFELVDVMVPKENKLYFGGNHWTYEFTLKNIGSNQCLSYTVVLDRRRFSSKKESQDIADGFFIRGAINVDELDQTRKILAGKQFYTLFPLKGKRYEPVTITKVEPGSWETPIRIHYRSSEVADTTVDVTLCGTNVPGNYIQPFHFTTFFSCDSKQGHIPNKLWDDIRSGTPKLGMSPEEVRLTLGHPKQVKKTETEDEVIIIYTYPEYQLLFKKYKLVKIESGS